MVEAIPDAELLWIEEGSHTTPIERPEAVRHAVIELLSRRVDPTFSSVSGLLPA